MSAYQAGKRAGGLRVFLGRFLGRPVVVFGVVVIVALVLTAVLAPYLAPYDPNEPRPYETLARPSVEHPLGTDAIGRDTLSRLIYGTRITLLVGVLTVAWAAAAGAVLGVFAGYSAGVVGAVIMRLMDGLMAFPPLVLALAIAYALGQGVLNVVLAIGISMVPGIARLIYGETLSVSQNDYVLAARAAGASRVRILFRHVLPNCFPTLIIATVTSIGGAILSEAGLSFLGIGIPQPTATWGSMVYDGYRYLLVQPVLAATPGIALLLVVLAFNMVGDGLRDALDPRLRGVL